VVGFEEKDGTTEYTEEEDEDEDEDEDKMMIIMMVKLPKRKSLFLRSAHFNS
jgi:hypothetical protein